MKLALAFLSVLGAAYLAQWLERGRNDPEVTLRATVVWALYGAAAAAIIHAAHFA